MPTNRGARDTDAVIDKIPDLASDDVDLFAGKKTNAVKACSKAFDIKALEDDSVCGRGINNNRVRARDEHARFLAYR